MMDAYIYQIKLLPVDLLWYDQSLVQVAPHVGDVSNLSGDVGVRASPIETLYKPRAI
jgi:hypothetical protein